MTREEFSKILRDARIGKGLTVMKMWQKSGLTNVQLQYIERGKNNYGLKNVLRYLSALELCLALKTPQHRLIVRDNADIVSFFRNERESKSITQLKLAELSNVSEGTLRDIEQQQTKFHIDPFLAVASALGVEVEICPIGN